MKATIVEIGSVKGSLDRILEVLDSLGSLIFCHGKYVGRSFDATWADDQANGFAYRKYCSTQGGILDSCYRLYGAYANMKEVAIQRNLYRIRECGWYAEASDEFKAFFERGQSQTM